MKILVFSDSHERPRNMIKALEMHKDADCIIHLGDGIKDLDALKDLTAGKSVTLIKGNAEDFSFSYVSYPTCTVIELGGKKIFACHGHQNSVKTSKYYLIDTAVKNDADIALFGHTHSSYYEYIPDESLSKMLVDRRTGNPKYKRDRGLYIFNPGSISVPRDGKPASYGIIEIKENGVLFSHGNIDALSKA
ncbi:MAG: metallophosphoesterase [Clostridia bacterium]|nr:metallophosphoesterase [Clostridia bacterium]